MATSSSIAAKISQGSTWVNEGRSRNSDGRGVGDV